LGLEDFPGQPGNAPGGCFAVKGAFGGGLVNNPHGLFQSGFGLFGGLAGCVSGGLDGVLDPGLINFVSEISFFVLASPFQGGFMVSQGIPPNKTELILSSCGRGKPVMAEMNSIK
jgi:hypothetical protein